MTNWDVLCEPHGEDIDGLTECITGYINFVCTAMSQLRWSIVIQITNPETPAEQHERGLERYEEHHWL